MAALKDKFPVKIHDAVEFISHLGPLDGHHIFLALKDNKPKQIHGSLESNYSELKKLNDNGRDIYLTINKSRNQYRRKAEDIEICRAVFLDDDTVKAEPLPDVAFPLKPSLVACTSKGKYHYYWYTWTSELEEWKQVQKAAITKYETDETVRDLPRIMRLPGFVNHKTGDEVYIVHNKSTRYSWDEIKVAFAPLPGGQKPLTEDSKPDRTISVMIKTIVKGEADTGLHVATRDLSWVLVKEGLHPALIRSLFYDGLMSNYDLTDPRQKENYNKVKGLVEGAINKTTLDWKPPTRLSKEISSAKTVEFPMKFLPESMVKAVYAVAKFNMMDPNDLPIVALTWVAASVSRKAIIVMGTEDLQLFFALAVISVAPTGAYKSTTHTIFNKGFMKGEQTLEKEYRKQVNITDSQKRLLEKAKKFVENKLKNLNPNDPEFMKVASESGALQDRIDSLKVRQPSTTLDDITQEAAITQTFFAGGMAVYTADEAQSFFANVQDQYGNAAAKSDFLIRGITGNTVKYIRVKDGRTVPPYRPCVNVNMFTQPDVMMDFAADERANSTGLAARLVINWWNTSIKKVKTKENMRMEKDRMKEYWRRTEKLSAYRPPADAESVPYAYEQESDDPILIRPTAIISNDIQFDATYRRIFNQTHRTMEEEGDSDILNKAVATGYIMAACCYVYDNADDFFSTTQHVQDQQFMERVEAFTNWFIELKRVTKRVQRESTVLEKSRKIVRRMLDSKNLEDYHKGMTLSQFDRSNKRHGGTAGLDSTDREIYEDAIALLEEHDILRYVDGKVYLTPYIDECL